MGADKATPNPQEQQEIEDLPEDQLEEVSGGVTYPSLPDYYPINGSNPPDGDNDQNSAGSIPKAG